MTTKPVPITEAAERKREKEAKALGVTVEALDTAKEFLDAPLPTEAPPSRMHKPGENT